MTKMTKNIVDVLKLLLLLLLFYMLSFEFIYMHDMSKLINALCKII